MGMEFTYSIWVYLNDDNFTTYNGGVIKHIFNKGAGLQLAHYHLLQSWFQV